MSDKPDTAQSGFTTSDKMGECIFVKPDIAYAEELLAFKKEFLDAGSTMDGCGELRRTDDMAEYIRICDAHTRKETLPQGRSLSHQLWYVRKSDGRIIGMLSIRMELIGYLEKFGGNIGYAVRPSERRKGHAKRMLAQALPVCRELGLKRVLVTCLEDNIGSEKTIRANGGAYESTVYDGNNDRSLKRFWIEL